MPEAMMGEPTPEMLTEILGEVLQESAFCFAEPAEEPEGWQGPLFNGTIAFESLRGGSLRLTISKAAAIELAANMLGIDPGDKEAQQHGRAAVSEVLNVVGGAFVTRYFGTKVPSQLGLPVTLIVDQFARAHRSCAAAVTMESGQPVLLELDLETPGG